MIPTYIIAAIFASCIYAILCIDYGAVPFLYGEEEEAGRTPWVLPLLLMLIGTLLDGTELIQYYFQHLQGFLLQDLRKIDFVPYEMSATFSKYENDLDPVDDIGNGHSALNNKDHESPTVSNEASSFGVVHDSSVDQKYESLLNQDAHLQANKDRNVKDSSCNAIIAPTSSQPERQKVPVPTARSNSPRNTRLRGSGRVVSIEASNVHYQARPDGVIAFGYPDVRQDPRLIQDFSKQGRRIVNIKASTYRVKKGPKHLPKEKYPSESEPFRLKLPSNLSRFPTLEHLSLADLRDDFIQLDSAIERLASALDIQLKAETRTDVAVPRQSNQAQAVNRRSTVQNISDHLSLIRGVPDELWERYRASLLHGAIWSILFETVFLNKFAVFGKRARYLAQEWVSEDVDPSSEAWRTLTAGQLLIRCGIAQCEFSGEDISSHSLRSLFHNRQNLDHFRLAMANSLMGNHGRPSSENEWESARSKADIHFRDADPIAMQSIHDARTKCIQLLQKWAGPILIDQIQEMVTHAQVLAVIMCVSRHCFQFIVPVAGRTIDNDQQYPAKCCTLVQQGEVVFTVCPGLKRYRNADNRELSVLLRSQVFLNGPLGMITATNDPPPTPIEKPIIPETSNQKLHSEEVSSAPDDLLEGVKSVPRQFNELRDNIISFTRLLDTYNGVDQHRQLQSLTMSDVATKLPWEQPRRNHFFRESAIWSVLLGLFSEDSLGIFKNYDNRLSVSDVVYKETSKAAWLTDEPNQRRWLSARQLVRRIGGRACLALAEECDIQDKELNRYMIQRAQEIYDRLATILVGEIPTQLLEPLAAIIRSAFGLSMTISVHERMYTLWRPNINDVFSSSPMLEFTEHLSNEERGRVVFVVRPGLYQRGDSRVRNANDNALFEMYTPALVRLVAHSGGGGGSVPGRISEGLNLIPRFTGVLNPHSPAPKPRDEDPVNPNTPIYGNLEYVMSGALPLEPSRAPGLAKSIGKGPFGVKPTPKNGTSNFSTNLAGHKLSMKSSDDNEL